jgi:lipopolysaccharide/colanic/teichoic acid biosynthesis glycosyltransferase
MLIRGSLLEDIGGIPVVVFPATSLSGMRLITKYVSDFCFALIGMVGLILLAPVVFAYQSLTHRNYGAWGRAGRQLGMVLVGKRSLVGPMAWVGGESVKPGITGIWLTATDRTTETQKQRLDLYYLQNWSLSFDIEIMLLSMGLTRSLFGSARQGGA